MVHPKTDLTSPPWAVPGSVSGGSSGETGTSGPDFISPEPSPGGRGKRIFKVLLKVFLSLLGLAIIAGLVLGFLIFVQGREIFGYSVSDKIWTSMIDSTEVPLAERSIKVSYQDSGLFDFVPSKLVKELGLQDLATQEELDEADKYASFTLKDFGVGFGISGFANDSDRQNVKVDVHLEGNMANNSKEYDGSVDLRLVDSLGYVKYDFNNSIDDLSRKFDDIDPIISETANRWKGKWFFFDNADVSAEEASTGLNPLASARAKSRDAKRLADMRQMASALEIFYNDFGGYPESINEQPYALTQSIDYNGPYIGILPEPPVPSDGKCLDAYNKYSYTTQGSPKVVQTETGSIKVYPSYQYVFCLGYTTGGYKGGNLSLGPNGITAYTGCVGDENCYRSGNEPREDDPIIKLYKENRIFDVKKLKGIEKIHDAYTLHYELKLNKENLLNIFKESMKEDLDFSEETQREAYDLALSWITAYLDNLEVNEFDVWVGIKDRRIYKFVLETNSMSLSGVLDTIYKEIVSGRFRKYIEAAKKEYGVSDASSPDDTKRLADMRELASALELYYNDNGRYPEAENGVPVGLTPYYIGQIPTAPLPAGGNCTDYFNTYWYTVIEKNWAGDGGENYAYTFCLGQATGGYPAGVTSLYSWGISHVYECPDPENRCYVDGKDPGDSTNTESDLLDDTDQIEQDIKDFSLDLVKNSPYRATQRIEVESWNYEKDREVQKPDGAVDIKKELQKEFQNFTPPISPFPI